MTASAIFAIASALLVIDWVCRSILATQVRRKPGAVYLFGALWFAIPSAVAASGFLADFDSTPPRMFFMLVAVLLASSAFAFSRWGTALRDRFSLAALIGFHAFRVMPEALLLLAFHQGLAPIQMTLEGRNWDVLSAILAACVFVRWRNAPGGVPRWAALGWSVLALGLLANIVGIAVLSMPTAFRQFHNEPANTFVASFPYILLPAVHVTAALAGHLLVLRKLAR
jgi:hypothetical protein